MAALEGGEARWMTHRSRKRGWCGVERTHDIEGHRVGSQRDERGKQKDTEPGGRVHTFNPSI